MLRSLHIENIAVVRCLDVDFDSGFTVLTGETGAGKSVIIDSINFLGGKKGDREMIRLGEQQALVSALFDGLSDGILAELSEIGVFPDESGELLIERSLSADGRSRARINGRAVNLTLLREVTSHLVQIHGQNDNRFLVDSAEQMKLLDGYAENAVLLAEYREKYTALCQLRKQMKDLMADESERLRTVEMLRFQIEDIAAARLKAGEEDRLNEKRMRVRAAERITKQAQFAYRALRGSEKASAAYTVERSIGAMRALADVVPEASELEETLTECLSMIEDAAERIYSLLDDADEDPTALLDKIETRLEIISRLKRKYGATEEDVLRFKENAEERLSKLENLDSHMMELQEKERSLYNEASLLATELHRVREIASRKLTDEVVSTLAFLDMPKVRFDIRLQKNPSTDGRLELSRDGLESVGFLLAANVGEPLHEMSKIASGGELARIMLSLKSVMANKDGVPTVIFDEVDTGVSGKTSRKIGIKLLTSSVGAQVLSVTHSAQIASLADCHLKIEKRITEQDRTETSVFVLDEDRRVIEIARILGGIEITEVQRAAAKEMLAERTMYISQ